MLQGSQRAGLLSDGECWDTWLETEAAITTLSYKQHTLMVNVVRFNYFSLLCSVILKLKVSFDTLAVFLVRAFLQTSPSLPGRLWHL